MTSMRFWHLRQPAYDSDYRRSYINGSLEHPFGLPGVTCHICGATWAGIRILPFACPAALRNRKELNDRRPIPLAAHKALQDEVLTALHTEGVHISELRPGDHFQPCYLDLPSRPRADFLWSHLGSVIVSERVKRLLEELSIEGVSFCDVTLRKVGKREAQLPPLLPTSGEPEDIIDAVPLLSKHDAIGSYYELIVLTESGYPPGGEPRAVCAGCGRPELNTATRKIIMTPAMWRGAEIFLQQRCI